MSRDVDWLSQLASGVRELRSAGVPNLPVRSEEREAHVSAGLLDDYWFNKPLSVGDQEQIGQHLRECALCGARARKFEELFPDRVEPKQSSFYYEYRDYLRPAAEVNQAAEQLGPDRKLFALSVDPSADVQAAEIIRALKRAVGRVRILGVGGEITDQLIDVYSNWASRSVVGIIEPTVHLRRSLQMVRQAKSHIENAKPDVLLMISSPGLNLRLLPVARLHGISSVYYLPRDVWAYSARLGVVERVIGAQNIVYANTIVTAFDFEAEYYREYLSVLKRRSVDQYASPEVLSLGGPILEHVRSRLPAGEVRKLLSLREDSKVIGLFPGSRWQEIRFLLRPILDAAEAIASRQKNVEFVLPMGQTQFRGQIERVVGARREKGLRISLVDREYRYEAMSICSLIVGKSGTTSLEATWFGIPCVVVYRLPVVDYVMARLGLKFHTKFIGWPNILAGEMVCPELIQWQVTGEQICREAMGLLADKSRYDEVRERVKDVARRHLRTGSLSRMIKILERVLERKSQELSR